MSDPNHSSPTGPLIYDSVVRGELHCVHCGFSLTGMKTYQRCRSCNTSVKKSLHLGLLIFQDPKILIILRVVVVLVVLSTLCAWVPTGEIRGEQLVLTCQPLVGFLWDAFTEQPGSNPLASWLDTLMPLQPLFLALAAWLLTRPRLPITLHSRRPLPEWLIRLLVWTPILGPVVVILGGEMHNVWVRGIGTVLCGTLLFTVTILWNRVRNLAVLASEPRLFFHVGLARGFAVLTTAAAVLSMLGSLTKRSLEIDAGRSASMVYLQAGVLPVASNNVQAGEQLIRYVLSWPLALLCLWVLPVLIWFVRVSYETYLEAREAPHDVHPNQSI